jgi:hypothetical protein
MSKAEANRLLALARDGEDISGALIARALRSTGDISSRIGRPADHVPAPGPYDWLLPSQVLQ